jgi:hypothetical protein
MMLGLIGCGGGCPTIGIDTVIGTFEIGGPEYGGFVIYMANSLLILAILLIF